MRNVAAALIGLAAAILAACSTGTSSPPPTGGISVEPRDSSVLISWTPEADVDYWLIYAPGQAVSSQTVTTLPGGRLIPHVGPPLHVSNLVNGTTYSFTVNGRKSGGPGGTDAPVVSATPRLAGSVWTPGVLAGGTDLAGVGHGQSFVAVGAGGATFYSSDATSWTAVPFVVSTNLNAVTHNATPSIYVAVGDIGTIIASNDAQTWQVQVSGVTARLAGIASSSGNFFVAVGASGTLLTSVGATTWKAVPLATAQNLNGAAYGNGMFVVVGANGLIMTSTDGVNWPATPSGTSQNLNAVAYGVTTSGIGEFVAVGAAGTVLTSLNGINWTLQSATLNDLTGISYGTQFVAVGKGGTIITSPDGLSWGPSASGTSNTLAGIVAGNLGYAAVGTSGTNLSSY